MKYIILEIFGPGSDGWSGYSKWAGLEHCTEYYSIDGLNRKSLFHPESKEDWNNCILYGSNSPLITNLEYALSQISNYANSEIIGVIEDPKSSDEDANSKHILKGYDIIDGYGDISLLTNWGGKSAGINEVILNNSALIDSLDYAYQTKEMLRREFSDDNHAEDCEVWAVYQIKV